MNSAPQKYGHFSKFEIEEIYSVDQNVNPFFKPRGLWFEVEGDDSWQIWCEENSFGNLTDQFHYRLNIDHSAKILKITNPAEIDQFHLEYQLSIPKYPNVLAGEYIDWAKIACDYDGILITPFIWERASFTHLCYRWYSAWDVASGCLWRPKGSKVELIRPPSRNATNSTER